MDKLFKFIDEQGHLFALFLLCLVQPTVQSNILQNRLDRPGAKIILSFNLWVISLLLSIVSLLPLYALEGLHWNETGYLLSRVFTGLLAVTLAFWLLHLCLLARKIPSEISTTFLLFTVTIAPIRPFIEQLSWTDQANLLTRLRLLKAQSPTFDSIIYEIFHYPIDKIVLWQAIGGIISKIALGMLLVRAAILVELLSVGHEVERHKVVSAVGLALGLSIVGTIGISALTNFINFVFLEGTAAIN